MYYQMRFITGKKRSRHQLSNGTNVSRKNIIYLKKSKRRDVDDDDDNIVDECEYGNGLFGLNDNVSIKDNHIYFRGTVTSNSVSKLINLINEHNDTFLEVEKDVTIKSIEPNPLYLHITSYGGCVFSCFRAIDCIKNSRIPIHTVIDGHAASAATLMSIVGKKRYITPHSYALIHQLSSGAIGTYWAIKDEFQSLETIMDDIYNVYTSHSDLKKEDLEEMLAHDIWWNAKTCIDKTIVDEIYDANNL